MEGTLLGRLRKGAWTDGEDVLLRKCVEKYGEGKWHLVPSRAGLNRCRKSCRLRWLNYLSPNIKRGTFSPDEVDLIIRLHKLLGNRWSLIAGRLPGRTANDVKNYWNTRLQKKPLPQKEKVKAKAKKTTGAVTVIRPRPRSFFKNEPRLSMMNTTNQHNVNDSAENLSQPSPISSSAVDNGTRWWDNLLLDDEIGRTITTRPFSDLEEEPTTNLPAEHITMETGGASTQEGHHGWSSEFFNDQDLWNLINSD